MKCKCCKNFMVLGVERERRPVRISADLALTQYGEIPGDVPPNGWYLLYPPRSTSPKLIYFNGDLAGYEGYSTVRSTDCHDLQDHLVGRMEVAIGCVEDSNSSYQGGEEKDFAGFNILNSLSGRFRDTVSHLYHRREFYGFMKYTGFFKDETDTNNAVLGAGAIRYVPESKYVPRKVFGQAFEATFSTIEDAGFFEPMGIANVASSEDIIYQFVSYNPDPPGLTYDLHFVAVQRGTILRPQTIKLPSVVIGKVVRNDLVHVALNGDLLTISPRSTYDLNIELIIKIR